MFTSRLNAIGLIFFTLSWLNYDHYRPWLNFHAEAFAIFGLSCLALSLLFRSGNAFKAPKVSKWIAFVAVVPWIQYFSGISLFAGDALISGMYLLVLSCAVWVGFQIALTANNSEESKVAGLMHSLWVAAGVSAAIGLAQWFNVQEPVGMYVVQSDIGDRAMGNLGQPNQLATFLLMGMVAFAWVFERKLIGRVAFGLGIGFMTLVLVMAYSRAGMIGVLLVAGFFLWKKRRLHSRIGWLPIVAWVGLYVAGTIALPPISEMLLMSDNQSFSRPEAVGQRVMMWKQVGYAIWQAPWFGYGWNQTPTAQAAGAVAYPYSVTYTNAHSFVMDMLAWNGLPLGLLLVGVIAWWFLSRLWACTSRDSVFAMAALLPFAMHSMVEYPFAYAYFLVAAGLFVGVVEAGHSGAKPVSFRRNWVLPIVIVWAGIGSYVVYEYLLVEEDFQVTRYENLKIGQTAAGYQPPNVWMLSHMGTMLKAARMKAHPGMSATEIETLRTVSSRFAYGAVRFRYAQALALNGDPKGAVNQLAIIHGMYGQQYHAACLAELQLLANTQYPQLAAILKR